MSQTQHVHRILITISEEIAESFGRWYALNIDPNDDTSAWPRRNKHGRSRQLITYRVSDGAYTDSEAKLIANKIAELSRQQPPDWDDLTLAQRQAWFRDNNTVALKNAGVYPDAAANTSNTWPDPIVSNTAVGVKTITDVGDIGSIIFAEQIWPNRVLPAEWSNANSRVTRDFTVSDVIVELTLTGNGTIVLRHASSNSEWQATLHNGPNAYVTLSKVTPQIGIQIVAKRQFPTVVTSVLTAQTSGNTITVSLNGVPVIRHVDPYNNTKTRHGFMVNSAWTTFTVRQ